MIFQIIKTELLAILRDRRSLIMVVASGALLFFAVWGGSSVSQISRIAHDTAMKKAREQWGEPKISRCSYGKPLWRLCFSPQWTPVGSG